MIPPDIIRAAQLAERTWKVPASVSLAQYALESAWGKHVTGPYNYFGMKCRHGEAGVLCPTHEFHKGQMIRTSALFRSFPSPVEAFDAHARLLATAPCYQPAMRQWDHPQAFVQALTGVYATDPHYGDKLAAIMRDHDLEQYDRVLAPHP